MKPRLSRHSLMVVGAAAVAAGGPIAAYALDGHTARAPASANGKPAEVVRLKDARLKFELNATDRDAGVQLFVDADEWRNLTLFDPKGKAILTTTTAGRMAKQGGTELFMESAEPPLAEFSLSRVFRRWPAGKYRIRGTGLNGERLVGSAILSHVLPAGPRLLAPADDAVAQPLDLTVSWEPVAAPPGGKILGYQVLVVQPDTGIKALPKRILDVMMPPTASSLAVPPGFLQPGTKYEWEVLALDRGGNQTLSSRVFTTAP